MRISVSGIQVCNETSRTGIRPADLVEHYKRAAAVIREAGMRANSVTIVCPCYYQGANKAEFLDRWRRACVDGELDNCALDFHMYFFGDWANERDHGPVTKQVQSAVAELSAIPLAVVGEWSVAAMKAPGQPLEDATAINDFMQVQYQAYSRHASHGSFFWTWLDSSRHWCRQAAYLTYTATCEPEAATV